jgi:FKBP-type peptidyl-prolyl cis-trans isomerase FkpA
MKASYMYCAVVLASGLVACDQQGGEPAEATDATESKQAVEEQNVTRENASEAQIIEVASGLSAKVLQLGYGRAAAAGDYVEVHYTGWLYDETAADNRGDKFDSSVDRGQKFQFTLGAGQVIKGWDEGVAGMLIGEKRELTLSPDMGYGERGAGSVIPPGAMLVFEVELFGLEGPNDTQ